MQDLGEVPGGRGGRRVSSAPPPPAYGRCSGNPGGPVRRMGAALSTLGHLKLGGAAEGTVTVLQLSPRFSRTPAGSQASPSVSQAGA